MNLSEAADKVIDLARKVREYYETELPKRHRNYPLVNPDEEGPPPPPEEKALREFLSTLSDDLIYQLMLIMYLGRQDFGTDDLVENYEILKSGERKYAVSEMMHYVPLADELLDGLAELRKHSINVDKLPLKKAKVRKR